MIYALLLLLFALVACGGGGSAAVPPVTATRPGVLPIYFGATDDTASEIAAETGTIWTLGWGDNSFITHANRHLLAAQQMGASFGVLGTQARGPLESRPDLDALFSALRASGTLSMVKWLFIYDEPEQHGETSASIAAEAARVRGVAAHYPELDGVKILLNFGCANDFVGAESADIIACDRYDRSASETLGNLKAKALGKPLVIFSGGAEPWRADPMPYVDAAMRDPQVIAVAYFLRSDYPGGLGIAKTRPKDYCSASATLRAARLTIC
jgi:hypothetical protein